MYKKYWLIIILSMIVNSVSICVPKVYAAENGGEIIWLEAEEITQNISEGVNIERDSNASNGRLLTILDYQPEESVFNFSYSFTPTADRAYNIYMLASPANEDWLEPVKYSVDGGEKKYLKDCKNYINYGGGYQTSSSIAVRWQMVDQIHLTAQNHSIEFTYDKARTMNDDGRYVAAMDAVVIVPANTEIDLTEKTADEGRAELVAGALYIGTNTAHVTNDLTLIDNLCGASVIWSSDNENVITRSGKITRGMEEGKAMLTAMVTSGKGFATRNFYITVSEIDYAEDKKQYAVLTAEDAAVKNYEIEKKVDSVGDYVLYCNTTDEDANVSAEFDFNIEDSGEYELWILATSGNNQLSSPYSYSIDESTEKENRYSISSVYENSDGVSVGWSNPDNFNLSEGQHKLKIRLTDMRSANLYDKFYQQLDTIVLIKKDAAWSRGGYTLPSDYSEGETVVNNSGITIGAGTHTLSIMVDELRSLANDFMYYTFDAVAIVPHNSSWTPNGFSKPQNGIWLEAEDFNINCSDYEIQQNSSASGGKVVHIDTTYSNKKKCLFVATKDFTLDEAGEYDIIIISTAPQVEYLSKPKWRIDGEVYQYMQSNAESDVLYTVEQYTQEMRWYTMGTVNLQSSELIAGMANIPIYDEAIYDLYFYTNNDFIYAIDEERYRQANIVKGRKLQSGYHWDKIGTTSLGEGIHTIFFKSDTDCVRKIMAVKKSAGCGPYSDGVPYRNSSEYARIDYSNVTDSQNVTSINTADSVAGNVYCVNGENENASIRYTYSIPKTNEYDIWILSNRTDVDYLSKFLYSIDGEDSKEYSNTIDEAVWTNYMEISAGWSKLTTKTLAGGTGTIDISFIDRVINNQKVGAVDTIFIVPAEWQWTPKKNAKPYNTALIDAEIVSASAGNYEIERNSQVSVSFETVLNEVNSSDIRFEAELKWNDEVVSKNSIAPSVVLKNMIKGQKYENKILLDVPSYAPDGIYTVQVGISGTNIKSEIIELSLGSREYAEKRTVKVNELSLDENNNCTVTFNANFKANERARLEYWSGDILWGVSELGDIDTEISEYTIDNILVPKMKKGIYEVRFGISGAETAGKTTTVTVNNDADVKPLSNGRYYNKLNGRTSLWYVKQNGAMMWDSEEYIPMGGMFCSSFIQGYDYSTPEANKKNLEEDIKVLDELKKHGINDLYINANVNGDGKLVAWQYMIDVLESKGFRYGIQLSNIAKTTCDGYFVGANVNAVTAVVQNGQTYAQTSIIQPWLKSPEKVEARFFVTDGRTVLKQGTARVRTENDKFVITADVGGGYDGKTVYFMFMTYDAELYAPNTFVDRDIVFGKLSSFFEKLDFGNGIRFTVDPLLNETNYANQTVGFRPYCGNYNLDFEEYLKGKYKTLEVLNNSWCVEPRLTSFKEAAHLIPFATLNNDTWLQNVENYRTYRYDNINGCMWDDCVQFRNVVLNEANMEAADVIKESADIPVIYKNVAYYNDFFVNTKTSGGHDGVGAEGYGDFGRIAMLSGVNSAICAQSSKTMWNIVTETNIEENVVKKYESGIVSYPDKTTMHRHFDILFSGGAKGIFDFLFCNTDPYLKSYAYTEKPELFDWLQEYRQSLNYETIAETERASSLFTMYPASPATWNWTGSMIPHNKRTVVLSGEDSTIKAVDTLDDGALFSGTNDIMTSNDKIVVSISNGPASKVYGPTLNDNLDELLKKKTIIVMGLRKDIGSIPAIDKYYTGETRTLTQADSYGNKAGDTVQLLNPPNGAEILFRTIDGDVWAFRYGNLWVFANENWSEGNIRYLSDFDFDDKSIVLENVRYEQSGQSYAIPQLGLQDMVCTFNNYSSKDIQSTLIIALNHNEGIITKDITIPANSKNTEIKLKINNPVSDTERVNYYLWDSIDGMLPIMQKR